ncbi:hypothetical protein LZ31DRAFT_593301 [Colletotrichum somersetense]|nr:hypothetical protein LZ31DRAFT_593301 [Colletotrichum somersetense]
MKSLIVNALIAAFVAGVTEACATYNQCRCTMSDNTINDTITQQACDYLVSSLNVPPSEFGTQSDSSFTTWCLRWGKEVDNCQMREACASVIATGSDSWCEKW